MTEAEAEAEDAAQAAAAEIRSGRWDRHLPLLASAIKARREQINRDRRTQ